MPNKSAIGRLMVIVLILGLILLGLASFVYIKKLKKDFRTVTTALLRDNQGLKSRVELLQGTVKDKTDAIETLEKEKKAGEEEIGALKEENAKMGEEVDALTKKKEALRKRIYMLEKAPLAERIKAAMRSETDKRIVNILNDTLDKIELVKSGKSVTLEPIEVSAAEKRGIILSVDRRNDLVVVNIGTKNGLMEGDRVKLYSRDGKEMASSEVISARYAISACFVDDFNYGFSIRNIKEGCRAAVIEKE